MDRWHKFKEIALVKIDIDARVAEACLWRLGKIFRCPKADFKPRWSNVSLRFLDLYECIGLLAV